MNFCASLLRPVWALAAALGLAYAAPAQAHLMVAQNGTLNLVGEGAFLVMSVPVAALASLVPVDDDGDGKLSMAELRAHFDAVQAALGSVLVLEDDGGRKPLQGMMLTLSPPDDAPSAPASQLVVMGRFALGASNSPLRLHLGLFGPTDAEKSYRFKITQGSSSQLLTFTPEHATRELLPSSLSLLGDYTRLGAQHILTGWDHLLFLLVVLASGWRWRQVVVALSCFTLGHAATLALSLWGLVQISPRIVEPAIAATIVAMVLFDWRARRREAALSSWKTSLGRLGMVFGCALIHGLGLASSLQELGLDPGHRLLTLLGFNLGIEIGQMAVAAAFTGLLLGLRSLQGARAASAVTQGASAFALLAGAGFFVQRLMAVA